jgi:hypothetical protein
VSSTKTVQMFYAACTGSETMFTSRSGGGIQQFMQPLASDRRRGTLALACSFTSDR